MRNASKYSMENLRVGIVIMVSKQAKFGTRDDPLQVALERLGLIFELPTRSWGTTARLALLHLNCSTVTARDLTPLRNRWISSQLCFSSLPTEDKRKPLGCWAGWRLSAMSCRTDILCYFTAVSRFSLADGLCVPVHRDLPITYPL